MTRIEDKVDALVAAVNMLVAESRQLKKLRENDEAQEERLRVLETDKAIQAAKAKLWNAVLALGGTVIGGVGTAILAKVFTS